MQIDRVDDFIRYWNNIRRRTLRVAERIPDDRFDWRYREGKFSFADILRHLGAIERFMFAENVQGNPSLYPGHGLVLADGPDEVLLFLNRMHTESVEIFSGLSAEQLGTKCVTPAGIPITAWKWLRAMVEHEIHHRGQIYVYLGMLDIPTPPLYGLTAEQVFDNSIQVPE